MGWIIRTVLTSPPGSDLRSCFQTVSSFAAAAEPAISTSSPVKTLLISGTRLRVAELMLERMQQFKRVKPKQLKHTWGGSLPETMADGNLSGVSQEKNQLGNGICLLQVILNIQGM